MSRQVRISIDDDEVFERLKRRKDALDLSWEDALRRGLRDSAEPPRGPQNTPDSRERRESPSRGGHAERETGRSDQQRESAGPFDPDFGEQIARRVLNSVNESIPGAVSGAGTGTGSTANAPLDAEIDRLEDAEDAVLVLGESERERVPLRVALHTGPDGLDVEVVAVRSGKGTEEMNRFADGARADVARCFAAGDTATLELDGGEEVYDVLPDLTWARGSDGTPTVTDVAVRDVVFED